MAKNMGFQSTSGVDFTNLYWLHDPLANRPLRLQTVDKLSLQDAYQLTCGLLHPTQPIRLVAYMGGQPAPFLWTGFPLVCAHLRVVELLQQQGLTGWATYPVEVTGRKGESVPDYTGFAVTGPQLDWDMKRSTIVTKPPIVPTGPSYQVYQGLYFDPTLWDGSDFFWIRGYRIVSEAVMKALKRAKITNVRFEALSDIERDVSMVTSSIWQPI